MKRQKIENTERRKVEKTERRKDPGPLSNSPLEKVPQCFVTQFCYILIFCFDLNPTFNKWTLLLVQCKSHTELYLDCHHHPQPQTTDSVEQSHFSVHLDIKCIYLGLKQSHFLTHTIAMFWLFLWQNIQLSGLLCLLGNVDNIVVFCILVINGTTYKSFSRCFGKLEE